MLLSELGQRIRSRRERLGLKQLDIANALQVSPQAVSKWERGENGPDIAILGALSKPLGVSTDWLLDTYRLGLDEFDATVFTSTVLGAYAKSLRMKAGEFAVWANGFLFQLTETVLRYDGVPIKYMGDAFLCFFSGSDHPQRAAQAAGLAKRLLTDELVIGLHSGEIYLGTMGHPDYAHRDIAGEAVNIAFLVRNWAESHTPGGIAATPSVVDHLDEGCTIVQTTAVNFKGLDEPIDIHELRLT
jgi:class 3 adenylate cyclase